MDSTRLFTESFALGFFQRHLDAVTKLPEDLYHAKREYSDGTLFIGLNLNELRYKRLMFPKFPRLPIRQRTMAFDNSILFLNPSFDAFRPGSLVHESREMRETESLERSSSRPRERRADGF